MVLIMRYFFHFSSLYPTPYIELYYVLAYLNFILEFYSSFGTARSAQTHKSISFI